MRAVMLMCVATALLESGSVRASIIGFDDLAVSSTNPNPMIPNGYSGLNWNNVYVTQGTNIGFGYKFGTVSPSNVAFNGYGTLGTVSSTTAFTLNSAYFTSAFDTESVTVVGYVNGLPTYSSIFTALNNAPTLETFNWVNLTSFTFIGGTAGTYRNQVVLDTLTVNEIVLPAPVPEPSSFILLGSGLVGFAATRVRAGQAR